MSDSLGKRLASARRSLGVSLKDAETVTRIRTKYLGALENSDYDTLPSYPYVRGYLIAYCKYLNLDATELLQALELEMQPNQSMDRLRGVVSRREIKESQPALPAKTIVVIVAAAITITIIVFGVQRIARGPEPLPPVPTVPGMSEATSPPVSAENTAPPTTPSRQTTPSDSIAPADPFVLRVVIDPESSSWLKITVDGLLAYEGILTPGDTREWEVLSQATLQIGKPGAVTILRDDSLIEIPAGTGTPEITITADAVSRQ